MSSEQGVNREKIHAGAAVSGMLDARQAAMHVGRACAEQLQQSGSDGKCDLGIVFFSSHHVSKARLISELIRTELESPLVVGVSADGVLGEQVELERQPGVACLALRLPGVQLKVFKTDDLPVAHVENEDELRILASEAGFVGSSERLYRGTILMADPYSVPINAMLPSLSRARSVVNAGRDPRSMPILGGMLSAGAKADTNAIVINDSVRRSGGVGISFLGNVKIDSLVSQGCRPIGQPMVITGGKGQLITSLGGRPALVVLSELLDSLGQDLKQQVRRGLFVGRAVTEYKDRFGRDDFLIRNIIGVDHATGDGAIAVADLLKVGQTVQFHIRDAKTANEDLAMLLDAQRLYEKPGGALLFTCKERGTRMFLPPMGPNHDVGMISRAFSGSAEEQAGPTTAKMGRVMSAPASLMPIAGMFALGEIGPVGSEGQVFMHGQTACLALFRDVAE